MISVFILIVCSTAVFGAPTHVPASDEWALIFYNLTSEAQLEHYQILFDYILRNLSTIAEKEEKLDKWAEKNGISDKWATYTGKWLAQNDKFNKNVLTVIENLPIVYRKFSEIISNQNIKKREVKNAFAKLDKQFHLEGILMVYLARFILRNEEALMNGRSICSIEIRNSTTYLTVEDELKLILKNLSSEAQEDYFQILNNGELTLAEIDEKFEKWAEKHALSEKWAAYSEKLLARSEKLNNIVLSVIDNLPFVYRMYSEITTNRNQTRNAMDDTLDKLKETYCLEFEVILEIKHTLIEIEKEEDEKKKRHGENIEIGNKVIRKMKDSASSFWTILNLI